MCGDCFSKEGRTNKGDILNAQFMLTQIPLLEADCRQALREGTPRQYNLAAFRGERSSSGLYIPSTVYH